MFVYENMDDCKKLLKKCDDIILARQDGDLLLEKQLANDLINIYRNPQEILNHSSDKTDEKVKVD